MNRSRREFLTFNFKSLFVDTFLSISEELTQPLAADPLDSATANSYFDSYESCYAFMAEVSLEELQQDAAKLGLDCTGLAKHQIAKLIYKVDPALSATSVRRDVG